VSYFVGLDVSLDETAICIVDDAGAILREGKVDTEPEAIVTWLNAVGVPIADSGDVARSFRDHVARCSDMMSPA
jgi:transposase